MDCPMYPVTMLSTPPVHDEQNAQVLVRLLCLNINVASELDRGCAYKLVLWAGV